MKISKQIKISIRIILLFTIAMCISLVPDYAYNFFGDEYCTGYIMNPATHVLEKFTHYGYCHESPEWHWGYRHWLFFTMGFCLAIVQIVDIVYLIDKKE